MASPAEVAAPVSAQVVGNAFVQQYYHILHQSPGLVHKFYHDISKLGRPEEDGTMSVTTTMDEINAKIMSLNYEDFRAEIKSVDAQESSAGGVNVLVTGHLTGKDNILRNFTQSFFLAPQDKGYFVLNDMFRYMDKPKHNEVALVTPAEDVPVVTSVTPEQEIVPVVENSIPEEAADVTEEPQPEKIVLEENREVPIVDEEDQEPVPEVVDEVPDATQLAVEVNTKIEKVPKKSYASIVMDLKQNGVPFSSPPPPMRKPQPRNQEPQLNKALTTTAVVPEPASNVETTENGVHEDEGEGYSVYIKGLPMSATPAILEEEFKKFGPIKANGIQVRSNRQQQGFCFGFVEFETPEAVQKAIEASPVSIGGRNSVVEEKRSTNSRGGSRGRFMVGRGGGFRNEGMRGRGNYGGGRGYNRGGDFGGSRNDYGYRSGGRGGAASSRGSNGYQRDNNGGTARIVAQ